MYGGFSIVCLIATAEDHRVIRRRPSPRTEVRDKIYALAFLGIKNVFHEFSGFPIRVGRLMSLPGNKNGVFHKHQFWNVTWAIGEDMIHSQVDQSFGAGPVGYSRIRIDDTGLTRDA